MTGSLGTTPPIHHQLDSASDSSAPACGTLASDPNPDNTRNSPPPLSHCGLQPISQRIANALALHTESSRHSAVVHCCQAVGLPLPFHMGYTPQQYSRAVCHAKQTCLVSFNWHAISRMARTHASFSSATSTLHQAPAAHCRAAA
jgi:hypothetical protein